MNENSYECACEGDECEYAGHCCRYWEEKSVCGHCLKCYGDAGGICIPCDD